MKTDANDHITSVAGMNLSNRGLTKREYFAAMAMQGLVSSLTIGRETHSELICDVAIIYADELIKALNEDRL